MNLRLTQFCIALLATALVGAIDGMLVWGAIFRDVSMDTAMAAFSGLTAISGAAAAYLFRLNGHESTADRASTTQGATRE